MSKQVLVIESSLRNNSNSNALAQSFASGAKEAGNQVEIVSLKGKNIAFCRGCMVCQKSGECVIKDDAIIIAEKMKNVDVIVFASPIYYYEMSGQLKTMLDRANCLYTADYKFRDIYFLSAAAENEFGTDERAVHGIEGWIACFPKCRLAGKVFAGGVDDAGTIEGHSALRDAFKMGSTIR